MTTSELHFPITNFMMDPNQQRKSFMIKKVKARMARNLHLTTFLVEMIKVISVPVEYGKTITANPTRKGKKFQTV